jgi:hypothetical protein
MHLIAIVLFLQFGGGDQQGNPGAAAMDLPDVTKKEKKATETPAPPREPPPQPQRLPEPTDPEDKPAPVTPLP